jgi:hypothetical protein
LNSLLIISEAGCGTKIILKNVQGGKVFALAAGGIGGVAAHGLVEGWRGVGRGRMRNRDAGWRIEPKEVLRKQWKSSVG